eukprot:11677508-Alexandrium_andersonii.AAC.1
MGALWGCNGETRAGRQRGRSGDATDPAKAGGPREGVSFADVQCPPALVQNRHMRRRMSKSATT